MRKLVKESPFGGSSAPRKPVRVASGDGHTRRGVDELFPAPIQEPEADRAVVFSTLAKCQAKATVSQPRLTILR